MTTAPCDCSCFLCALKAYLLTTSLELLHIRPIRTTSTFGSNMVPNAGKTIWLPPTVNSNLRRHLGSFQRLGNDNDHRKMIGSLWLLIRV